MNWKLLLNFACIGFLVSACTIEPKAIDFGNDDCDYCKMTISDSRFGAEVLTKKGRVYKFDDMHCVNGFLEDEIVPEDQVHSIWLVDFSNPEHLIRAEKSFLLYNEKLQSPMGANIAAFEKEEELHKYHTEHSGEILKWSDFLNTQH